MTRWKPSQTILSTLATCALMMLLPAQLQSQPPAAPPAPAPVGAAFPPPLIAAPPPIASPGPASSALYHFQERRQQRINQRLERRHNVIEGIKSLFGLGSA